LKPQVCNFAGNPDEAELSFEQPPDLACQLRDGKDFAGSLRENW